MVAIIDLRVNKYVLIDGLDATFRNRLEAALNDPALEGAVRIEEGFRTREMQQARYDQYGPTRAAAPGTSNHERGVAADLDNGPISWDTIHEVMPRYGLRFPLLHPNPPQIVEPWHVEPDPDVQVPELPVARKVHELEFRILAPAGVTAKFMAPMALLPNGQLAALYCVWLDSPARVDEWTSRGATELPIDRTDLKNVPLFGGVPHGDPPYEWSAADFLTVS